jgi:hypothetical protein
MLLSKSSTVTLNEVGSLFTVCPARTEGLGVDMLAGVVVVFFLGTYLECVTLNEVGLLFTVCPAGGTEGRGVDGHPTDHPDAGRSGGGACPGHLECGRAQRRVGAQQTIGEAGIPQVCGKHIVSCFMSSSPIPKTDHRPTNGVAKF